jgi:uncharacterized protein
MVMPCGVDGRMKFTREQSGSNAIRKLDRGEIIIGETTYRSNLGLLVDRVFDNWPQRALQELEVSDLEPLLCHSPELMLIGSGWRHVNPPRELTFALARRGIGLEVMDTPAACRTFNVLIGEDRCPAAILYLDRDPDT